MQRRFIAIVVLCAFMLYMPCAVAQDGAAALIGRRADEALARFPVVDRVVLVPDEATYLDEIGEWSTDGVWPVLIEEARWTPMFVRAFKPAQVIRRDAVRANVPTADGRRALLDRTVTELWGGEIRLPNVRATFQRAGHVPAGVVISSALDEAYLAALPLCALRGQPVIWYEKSMPHSNAEARPDDVHDLLQQQIEGLNELAYPYATLGDAIETITVCRNMPGRVNVTRPGVEDQDRRAITDVLGRAPDGTRFAFTGWVYGDAPYCVYTAMSSLFLSRSTAMGVNTYELNAVTGKSGYDQAEAGEHLREHGWDCEIRQGDQASEWGWLRMLPGGTDADFLMINTKGNRNFFRMNGNTDCHPGDLPILNKPAVVHFIHSWSAIFPENLTTIAAQWRVRGAYAYVGSMAEPGLGGFVSPLELSQRLVAGEPFLVAARHVEAPVWRINTFGDPLATCRPSTNVQRIAPEADSRDLRERLKTVMRIADRKPSPEVFAEAIGLCNLLGEDSIGAELWKIARQKSSHTIVARASLGPLFRQRDVASFMNAWNEAGSREWADLDMLWHLVLTQSDTRRNADTLIQLRGNIRSYSNQGDVKRLAPMIASQMGLQTARQLVQEQINATTDSFALRVLRETLTKLK